MTLDLLGAFAAPVLLGLAGFYALHSLKPTVERQRAAVRAVSKQLTLRAQFIFNPGVASKETTQEVSAALRECAAELSATTEAVRFYRLLALTRLVHNAETIKTAQRCLIGLSNSIGSGDPMWNARLVADLEDALRLGTGLGYRVGDLEGDR